VVEMCSGSPPLATREWFGSSLVRWLHGVCGKCLSWGGSAAVFAGGAWGVFVPGGEGYHWRTSLTSGTCCRDFEHAGSRAGARPFPARVCGLLK
jgi:hypothetical protein